MQRCIFTSIAHCRVLNGCVNIDSVQVLSNPELRDMLMDVEFQKILQECSDPVKFQRDMRDPVIASKIKKMYESGLVGTAL